MPRTAPLVACCLCLTLTACHSRRARTPEVDQVALCDIDYAYKMPGPGELRPSARGWLEGPPVKGADQRVRYLGPAFNRYPPDEQARLVAGQVREGLDEQALFVARGQPELWWVTQLDGKSCRALIYAVNRTADVADLVVYTCGGTIERLQPLDPPIGCNALAAVAPRIDDERAYFATLPVNQQWDVLRGNLVYGRSEKDLTLTWGDPAKTFDREVAPGREVEVWSYRDASGQTGGLEVYLRNDKVVGWNVLPLPEAPPPAQAQQAPVDEEPHKDIARANAEQVVNAWMPFVVQAAAVQTAPVVISNSSQSSVTNVQNDVNTNVSTTVINNNAAPAAGAAQACFPLGGSCDFNGTPCCDQGALCDANSGHRCVRSLMGRCSSNAQCASGLRCKGGSCAQ